MSQINNNPVGVTAEERQHPAVRLLARACIELARAQLEKEAQTSVAVGPLGQAELQSQEPAGEEGAHA